jgi:uncharacterized membrane protein YebE (DUF533 family)
MKSNNVQTATKTIGALAVLGSLAYAFAQSNKKIKVTTAEKESTLELDDDFDELEPTVEELEEIEKELFYLLDDVETVIEDIDLDEELDEEI